MASQDLQSVLDYARLHGLCQDHRIDHHIFSSPVSFGTKTAEILDDARLPQFDLSNDVSTDDRLEISRVSAHVLADVVSGGDSDSLDAFAMPIFDIHHEKTMRLELPILSSEHDHDYRFFLRRSVYAAQVDGITFPLEVMSDWKNETLDVSTPLRDLGVMSMRSINRERIEVTLSGMEFLQKMLKGVANSEDEVVIREDRRLCRGRTALRPVTPPLSPASHQAPDLFEPSPLVCDIPLLSDPITPEAWKLENIESKILIDDMSNSMQSIQSSKHDEGLTTQVNSSLIKIRDIGPNSTHVDFRESTPLASSRAKLNDLKVEEPLTPHNRIEAQPKSVHFSDANEEMLLDKWSSSSLDPLQDPVITVAFAEAAQTVRWQIEQEQLVVEDAIARIAVPLIDLAMSKPPWQIIQDVEDPIARSELQRRMTKHALYGMSEWPGSNGEERKLNWVPIKNGFGKITLEGPHVEDHDLSERFIEIRDEDAVTSSKLTWKPEGLRILNANDDDEDEIKSADYRSKDFRGLSYLVRKRKLEWADSGSRNVSQTDLQAPLNQCDWTHTVIRPTRSPKLIAATKILDAQCLLREDGERASDKGLLLFSSFSAGNALDHFLDLRMKKPKLNSLYFPAVVEPNEIEGANEHPSSLPCRMSRLANAPITTPSFVRLTEPVQVIIASTLLRHRTLIRNLTALMPNIQLIEREFEVLHKTKRMPDMNTRFPIMSEPGAEADMLISPSAGVIITTLQKVKQKPLPGNQAKNTLIDRLEKVSLRYEKLIVLVSEDRVGEMINGLRDIDCTALCDLTGFACGLPSSIAVQFVAGGVEALVRWLGHLLIQYRNESVVLLEDETYWELFLRRVGMNAFGAQAVMGALKVPEKVDATSPSKAVLFGLTAFIHMSAEERLQKFARVCGPRVMSRVSALVDTRWTE